MTEAEWLACTEPQRMLEFLRDKASDRKLRLFAVACCRAVWSQINDIRSRIAVDVTEQAADGLITPIQLSVTRCDAFEAKKERVKSLVEITRNREQHRAEMTEAELNATWPLPNSVEAAWTNQAAWRLTSDLALEAALDVPSLTASAEVRAGNVPVECWHGALIPIKAQQCHLIRDIFGNPFRRVTADTAWLTPNVVTLAQTIYDNRAFDRLPELAAPLEQADCTVADVLDHCRQAGEHVRGCWVIDLLLDKE
jgi:hypothetical protein